MTAILLRTGSLASVVCFRQGVQDSGCLKWCHNTNGSSCDLSFGLKESTDLELERDFHLRRNAKMKQHVVEGDQSAESATERTPRRLPASASPAGGVEECTGKLPSVVA